MILGKYKGSQQGKIGKDRDSNKEKIGKDRDSDQGKVAKDSQALQGLLNPLEAQAAQPVAPFGAAEKRLPSCPYLLCFLKRETDGWMRGKKQSSCFL